MKPIKILVLCGAGMSSGVIVNRMKEAAEKQEIEADIHCHACIHVSVNNIDFSGVDVVLLAPQVRSQEAEVKATLAGTNVAVAEISMMDYGLAKGEAILQQAMTLIK